MRKALPKAKKILPCYKMEIKNLIRHHQMRTCPYNDR